MEIIIAKHIFLWSSFTTFAFSVIFMFLPRLYSRLEEILNMDLLPQTVWFTVLEGRINFINDWIIKNRIVFGVLFISSSIYNIKSMIEL
ncbi:MAG: hypothetical protein PHY46_03440 [Candidatus Omnitrophica bacterium]|nr:hypothetical protein [Candidatus Omnitrophota bacterium]MDD5355494.1 hypothetical protein [Candidatus Omnitrophota bacterium]